MGIHNLSILILQQITQCTVQYSGAACYQCCCMLSRFHACAACLDTDELDLLCIRERIAYTDCVASPTDAGKNHIWQASHLLHNLIACLHTYDRLEVAHDTWIRMWPCCRTEQIEGGLHVGHPVADSLVDSILQCARTTADCAYLGT